MKMTAAEIAVCARILDNRLAAGMIQKISQPSARRVVFRIWKPGAATTALLVDLTPTAPRCLPTERKFENPPEAPAFCLVLRRLLRNAHVQRIRTLNDDRIVALDITVGGEDGAIIERRIVVELIPAHPTLFVLDKNGRIEAASSGVKSPKRTLARGDVYELPPPPPLRGADAEPPPLFPHLDEWTDDDLFLRLDEDLPENPDGTQLLKVLRKAVGKALTRQAKRLAKVQQDVRKLEGGEEWQRRGELLKTSVHEVGRGMTEAVVVDWAATPEPAEETIPLDPKLTAQENVEALFKKAKRSARGREQAEERLREQERRLEDIRELRDAAEIATADEATPLAERARDAGIKVELPKATGTTKTKKSGPPSPRRPYFVFTSADDVDILVGRTARDNDELTFRVANGRDYWLHAQNFPGSHIVIRDRAELPDETRLDAATLAVMYSKAPKAGKQPVSITRRKWVTKFKGAPAGKVLLKDHKTIMIRMEPDRVARLEKSKRRHE